MSKKKSKTTRVETDQKLIAGVQKHFAGASLILAGKTYTTPDVVKILQERIDVTGPVPPALATYRNLVAAENAKIADTRQLVLALEQLVRAMFGKNAEALADFGLSPRTRAIPTTEAKALAKLKAKATRSARGTVGPKKKAKIKGVVPTPPNPIQPAPTAPAARTVTMPDAGNGPPRP